MKPPFLKTMYNHDRNEESDKTGLACKDESLTQQQYLEESNINFIAHRFGLTGELPTPRDFSAIQGDFEDFDLQTALNQIRRAEETFMEYPATLRAQFDNDPRKFVEFFQDPDNTQKAVKMGLATIRPQPQGETDEPGTQESTGSRTQKPAGSAGTPAPESEAQPAQKPGQKPAGSDRRGT